MQLATPTLGSIPATRTSAPGNTDIVLTWAAAPVLNAGVTYKVYQTLGGVENATPIFTGLDLLTTTVVPATPGVYSFRVVASKTGFADSASAPSPATNCTVTLSHLATPTSITGNSLPQPNETGSVTVTWTDHNPASANVAFVLEEQYPAGTGSWTVPADFTAYTFDGTTYSATFTHLAAAEVSGDYKFRVRATAAHYLDSNELTTGLNTNIIRKIMTPPSAIVVGADALNTGTYTVSWTAASTTSPTYDLQEAFSSDGGTTWGAFANVTGTGRACTGITAITCTVAHPIPTYLAGKYKYQVIAHKAHYTDSDWSTESTPNVLGHQLTILVGASFNPATVGNTEAGLYNISWPAVTPPSGLATGDVITYLVEESKTIDNLGVAIATPTWSSISGAGVECNGVSTCTLAAPVPSATHTSGTYVYKITPIANNYVSRAATSSTNSTVLTLQLTAPSINGVDLDTRIISWTASLPAPVAGTITYHVQESRLGDWSDTAELGEGIVGLTSTPSAVAPIVLASAVTPATTKRLKVRAENTASGYEPSPWAISDPVW
jgi:hypothetical protein